MDEGSERTWALVMTTESMMEAEIVKAKLQTFGIPAGLRFESAGRLYGITQDGLARVEIIVPFTMKSRAQEILTGT